MRASRSRTKARPPRRSRKRCGSIRLSTCSRVTRSKTQSSPACASRRAKGSAFCSALQTRDPERFPDPNVFDSTRSPNPHVSFGAGIHFCCRRAAGAAQLSVALPILFARLPGLRLAEPPRYRDAFHFHGLEALKVEWR